LTPRGHSPRVAIAHEWLVRDGGAERVLEQLVLAFPGSRILTTIADPPRLPPSLRHAEASFLGRAPGSRAHHEWYLPLMPLAWRIRRPVDDVDVVIASSYACANAVRVSEHIPLISYCHTPMRYAWTFEAESLRFPRPLRAGARFAMAAFRRWDRRIAQRVTQYVANSSAVAERVLRFYGRHAIVVHPPVRTEYFTPGSERSERFLYVGRLTGYKRPDLVVEAFRELPCELEVVGEGPMLEHLRRSAGPNVKFLGALGTAELRERLRAARALVYPVDEDFGIVMAEAQACGTPVVGLAAGGALDIVEDGVTGWLAPTQSLSDIRTAVRRAADEDLSAEVIRARSLRFSEEIFRSSMRRVVGSFVRDVG
jgi:glycosyltransferase involved in cell wall biosynthesis